MFTRAQRDAVAAARHKQGLSVAELCRAAGDGNLAGLPAFHVSPRTVNRICRAAADARELERQDREFSAKVEPIVRRIVAEHMAAREPIPNIAPTRHLEPSPAKSTGSLLDQLVAAENARDARDGAPDEPPERFQPARAPEPAPEPPDPEQAWADKITASIQAIADEAKADADRRHREAQAELEALLGIPGERALRAAPGGARKSGAVDAKYSRY